MSRSPSCMFAGILDTLPCSTCLHEEKVWRRHLFQIFQKTLDLLRTLTSRRCLRVVSHFPTSVTCIVDYRTNILSYQVKFLEYLFSQSFQSASKVNSASMHLINVGNDAWTTLCKALFTWSLVVLLTLQHENSDFSSKIRSPENVVSLCYWKQSTSSCKCRCRISDIYLTYRPEFLFETITQLTAH